MRIPQICRNCAHSGGGNMAASMMAMPPGWGSSRSGWRREAAEDGNVLMTSGVTIAYILVL
jgi:hypothetical protein